MQNTKLSNCILSWDLFDMQTPSPTRIMKRMFFYDMSTNGRKTFYNLQYNRRDRPSFIVISKLYGTYKDNVQLCPDYTRFQK